MRQLLNNKLINIKFGSGQAGTRHATNSPTLPVDHHAGEFRGKMLNLASDRRGGTKFSATEQTIARKNLRQSSKFDQLFVQTLVGRFYILN